MLKWKKRGQILCSSAKICSGGWRDGWCGYLDRGKKNKARGLTRPLSNGA